MRVRRDFLGVLLTTCLLAAPAGAAQIVYVDDAGNCQGKTPCFTTVQAGVNNASAPPAEQAQVRIFPGTYNESVDLSLMGSSVGGGPGDILLINQEFIAILLPAMATQDMPPWVSATLAAQLDEARAHVAELAAIGFPPPAQPNAAVLPVLINSPGGPAIRNSVLYPADITIFGIDVLSPNDNGVQLSGSKLIEFNFGNASGNFKNGVQIVSLGEVGMVFSTLNNNGGAGASLESLGDTVLIINSVADTNKSTGMAVAGFLGVQILRLPINDSPFTGAPDVVAARNNTLGGIFAESSTEGVSVVDLGVLVDFFAMPKVIVDDNKGGDGLTLNPDESAAAVGVQANRNKGNGVSIDTPGDATVAAVHAEDNDENGIEIVNSNVVFMSLVTANNNDLSGIVALSSGSGDFGPFFMGFGAILLTTSTDGNHLHGTDVTATGGKVFILGPTAIGNTVIGIRVAPPIGSQNEITGGIICSNSVGMSLLTNSFVNAEGNWWGSASGPQHATKNPGGTGNPVLDGTNGGLMGDVDFIPWIDTVTASVLANPSRVHFQFSGGGGTVFLGADSFFGLQQFGPGAGTPFQVTTDNGLIIGPRETGPTVAAFVNNPMGILELDLLPFRTGPATITLDGPCGLTASVTANVTAAAAPAPLLSGLALLVALSVLGAVGAFALRRLAPATRRFS